MQAEHPQVAKVAPSRTAQPESGYGVGGSSTIGILLIHGTPGCRDMLYAPDAPGHSPGPKVGGRPQAEHHSPAP
eukprot:scaffold30597_cov28-Tisochrysis_lutea.AAC.5